MSTQFKNSFVVRLKNKDWFERQKIAGKAVGQVLKTLNSMITDQLPNLSLKDLEEEAVQMILEWGCTPTFQGYRGFPGAICLSVNKELVHGIPSTYILQPGDVVKFDLGATYQGAIADAAATAIYGKPKSVMHVELIRTCKEALDRAIQSVAIGNQIGCIGYAIHRCVGKTRFGLVTNYGGHGIDENQPHAAPFISNKSKVTEGVRIQPGLTIAIEPMLTIGSPDNFVANDGWTVMTKDVGAHFEHTIFVGEDKVHVLTEW